MDRVVIGRNYENQPTWKKYVGVPLIYFPLIATIPFVVIGVLLVRAHLSYVGGMNIRSYWSFVPSWISHRYRYSNQIVYESETNKYHFRYYRWYWIFNCKVYCPMSVALFHYMTYLVMIVENWWCPFHHDKKSEYAEAAIDQSYWHIYEIERDKLQSEDRDNPIWNDEVEEQQSDQKND